MARTNSKTVSRFYDNDTVNGWDLKYDYESEDGKKPEEIKVNGSKKNFTVYFTQSASNTTIQFSSGSETDMTLINAINSEIALINSGFEA